MNNLNAHLPSLPVGAWVAEDPPPPSPARPREWQPPIVMLGVPFDNVTTSQAIDLIEYMVASRRPHYLATANVDFTVQALRDPELRRILVEAHLVVCDGMPLVWASKWLGNPLPERIAGSDLVPLLLQISERKGYRVFFLGGREDISQRAVDNALAKHPNLQVAGVYSPPFAPLEKMDHDGICQKIRESQADLLFVSFGCPKQEKWIAKNYRECGAAVAVGVGATIDFLAGAVARAPRWMQASGLEWIFRLLQEPRRLFRRYAEGLFVFGAAILRQAWQLRASAVKEDDLAPAQPLEVTPRVVRLPQRLDAVEVRDQEATWQFLLEEQRDIYLDATSVEFVDSTGVGLLVRLRKAARQHDRRMVIAGATPFMKRALSLMKLDRLFEFAPAAPALSTAH